MRSEVMPGASDNYMTLKAPKKGDILIKKAAVIPLLPSLPLNWGNGTNKGLIQEKQICGWHHKQHIHNLPIDFTIGVYSGQIFDSPAL